MNESFNVLTQFLVCCLTRSRYHYPLQTLRSSPSLFNDPDDAVYRRGAPDTFDAQALKHDLRRIRLEDEDDTGADDILYIPGFDHAKGDPEPDVYKFDRNLHSVVICEGLYLLHSNHGWEGISDLFDMTIYIHADVDMCVDRLKVRNLCIPGYTKEEIEERCDAVDRANAMTVLGSKNGADFVVDSVAL